MYDVPAIAYQSNRLAAVVFWALLALLLLPMVAYHEQQQIKVCRPSVQTTKVIVGWPGRIMSAYSTPCGDPGPHRTWHPDNLAWHSGGALLVASLTGGLLAEARRQRPRKVLTSLIILLGLGGLTLFWGGIGAMTVCRDKEGMCGLWFLILSLPGAALASVALIIALIGGATLAKPVRRLGLACLPLAGLGFLSLYLYALVR